MNKTSATLVRSLLLGTSCLSALGLTLAAAQADPTGGVVVSGGATIGGTQNNTVINQSTQRALINWQNFSVAAGGSVQFNQPNSG
ncbi:MAG: filamentous hemagglutinin, partial [Alphaproteobacteria bacterium]|nr:filamentous hemagglutinin [Alphaproteobacteria bacterium]